MAGLVSDFEATRTAEEWLSAAREICSGHGIDPAAIERSPGTDHAVFLVGQDRVLKIYHRERSCFEREIRSLTFVHGRLPVRTPELIASGNHEGFDYLIMSKIAGRPMTRPEFLALPGDDQNRIIDLLAAGFRAMHELDPAGITDDWSQFVASQSASFLERQIAHGVNRSVLDAIPRFLERNLGNVPLAPTVFMHGDVHFGNLRFDIQGGAPTISGLFDFADSRRGYFEYDFLAVGVLMIQGMREAQRRFLLEYGYARSDLDDQMRERLMMLTMLYETADLRRYALRLRPEAVEYPLDRLTREIWNFA
jgi:hygromycin-B 7''-O-kinase